MKLDFLKKFYDMLAFGDDRSGVHVVDTEERDSHVFIECECGTHLLQVSEDTCIYTNSNDTKQVRQSFNLAMFNYGHPKYRMWWRIKLAWQILKTGKNHADQMVLTPDEAQKFVDFIQKTKVETNE